MIRGDEESREPPLDFLWKVHSYTNEYIRFADSKAAFIVAIAGALIGVVISSRVFDGLRRLPLGGWPAVSWCAFFAVTCLSISVVCATFTVRPRLWGSAQKGVIYWAGVMRHNSSHTFYCELNALSEQSRAEAVADHLYILASICARKYAWLNRGIIFGLAGAIGAALAVLWIHLVA